MKAGYLGRLLAVVAIGLLAAGCAGAAAGAASVQNCGQIAMRGPNPPVDPSARQAEDCFWYAYQTRHDAGLVVGINGVDTVETHTLSVGFTNGKPSIIDTVQNQVIPARQLQPQTFMCSGLAQQQGGLLFQSCGDEGDFLVPAPR